MSQADGHVLIDTKIDESGANEGLQRLSRSAETALGVFTGQMMTKAFDALTNLGKGALDAGASFEAAMAKTSTLFQGSDDTFKDLTGDILQLSSASGLAATELGEAAYSALSASVPAEDLGEMLEKSSKLAAAGFTDVDTALSATAKTMNAYGETGQDAIDKVQKVLIQTQNLGITTVDELGASLAQVTPTAAAFGVSFEQVGASLATMTAQGTPTAQATTQLNSLIAELGKEGTKASVSLAEAAAGTKYAGMSFSEMMENGATLDEVLGMISEHADYCDLSMVDMFSSIEAGKAALSIFSNEGATFHKDLEQMSTDADVVGEAYSKVSDTFQFKSRRIKTSISNIGAAFFEMASGPIGDAAELIADALDSILKGLQENGLQGAMDAAAEAVGGFVKSLTAAHPELKLIVSAISTIIDHIDIIISVLSAVAGAMVALKILSFVQALMSVIGAIKGVISALTMIKSFAGLVSFITTLAGGPLVLIVAAIGAVTGALIYLWNTNEGFRTAVINAWNTIVKAAIKVWTAIASLFTKTIPEAIKIMQKWFSTLPGKMWGWLSNTITKVLTWAGQMKSNALSAASSFVSMVMTWFSTLPGKMWGWLSSAISKVLTWAGQMKSNASTAASNFISMVMKWLSTLPGKTWEWLSNAISKVLTWASQMKSNASSAASNFISEVVSWLSSLPGKMWSYLSDAARKVINWGSDLRSNASDAASKLLRSVLDTVSYLPGDLWDWLCAAADRVRDWGYELSSNARSAANDLVDSVINTVTSLPGEMIQVGKDIADGLANGIYRGIDWVIDAARSIASSAKASAQKELDSHSPSRVFEREVGATIPSGTAVGVHKGLPAAIKSMRKDMKSMVSALKAEVDDTFSVNPVSSSVGAVAATGGTTIYNDNHIDQTNTYNVPTATPSEVSKAQREAVRNIVGGVK